MDSFPYQVKRVHGAFQDVHFDEIHEVDRVGMEDDIKKMNGFLS